MELKAILESLIFASDKPLTIKQLKSLTGSTRTELIKATLDDIEAEFRLSGIQLAEVGGGYQFRTHPECAAHVKKLLAGRPPRLTQAMLETLAIVAYRQPITRPEIEDIRGVDCGGVLRLLLERALIRILGKKEEVGRPILYGTTRQFLEFFNLKDLTQLPTLREFTELSEEMASQLDPDEAALLEVEEGGEPAEARPDPPTSSAEATPAAPVEGEALDQSQPGQIGSGGALEPGATGLTAPEAAPADALWPEEPAARLEEAMGPFQEIGSSADAAAADLATEVTAGHPDQASATGAAGGSEATEPASSAAPNPTWARGAISPDEDEDDALNALDSAMSRVDEILKQQRQEERDRLRALVGEAAAAAAEAAAAKAGLEAALAPPAGDETPTNPEGSSPPGEV